jgi:hypothetical protein
MASQALANKLTSAWSPGDQRQFSQRVRGPLRVVPATSGGVDREPASHLTAHWKVSPSGRMVASWSVRPAQ